MILVHFPKPDQVVLNSEHFYADLRFRRILGERGPG